MELIDCIFPVDDIKVVNKRIQQTKGILEEQHGRAFTWEEATEGYRTIESLALVTLSYAKEQFRRKTIMQENPKGFHFDQKGYCCIICQWSCSGRDSWCDKYGLKCMRCQGMLDQKIIPASVARTRQSWYSENELKSYFNIDRKTLKKYAQNGKITIRQLPKNKNQVQMQICLLRDNKGVLPPKKILEGRLVRINMNGEEWYAEQHWYEYMRVKTFESLRKKYRVFDYLFETFQKPLDNGRLFTPEISPVFLPSNILYAEVASASH